MVAGYWKTTSVIGFILAVALLLVIKTNLAVDAQTEPLDDRITISISPQLLDLTANPGERLSTTFRLTNGSDQPVQIQATPKNFTPRGEEGAVDITEDRTDFSLAEWITVSPSIVEIAPRNTQDFEVFIDVPGSAEPGSHFGSVVFATIPPEREGAGAVVSQEIAPVILVKVAGDVVESADIAEFTTTENFYSNEAVVTFLSRLENNGTVHFKPAGKIVVKNMFGRVVAELDLDQRNVLPGSIRQISSDWNIDGLKIGRYTAELTVVYGDELTISNASTSFVIFPYQVIIPIVLLVFAVLVILYKGRRRISRAIKALSASEEQSKTGK